MSVCRVLLRQSAQLHDPSKHAAIDATFYDRSAASRHYCQRTSYRVQKLKVTKLVDTALKPSLTSTVQRPEKEVTQTLPSRSPAGTRAICGHWPPTRATTSKKLVTHSVNSISDR
jgi:IS5 family transposase